MGIECPHCGRISQGLSEDEFCSHCGELLAQKQIGHEDKQACGLLPSDNIATEEAPLFVLRPKGKWHYMAVGLVCLLTMVFTVGVILPVISSGNFTSALGASGGRTVRGAMMFYGGIVWCLYLPFWSPMLKKGLCCFYEDRMEVHSFLGGKVTSFNYNDTQVTCRMYGGKKYSLCCNAFPVPGYRSFLQRYKAKTLRSVTVGLVPYSLENPGCVETVVMLLKERVANYSEKPIGLL